MMDDDLPDISVNSIQNDSQEFEMPDANFIASQRKFEDIQESEIKKYQAEIAESLSCSEGSDVELSNCLEMLRVEIPNINIPFEHPGVSLDKLNLVDILGPFDTNKSDYIGSLLDFLQDPSNNLAMEGILTLFLDSLHNVIIEDSSGFSFEDIHCQIVALSILLLWTQSKAKVSLHSLRSYMHIILDEVGVDILNDTMLITIAEHLLKIFHNHHIRLYLAQCIQSSLSNPKNMPDTPMHSNKLALILYYGALSDLISLYDTNITFNDFNMTDLKDLIMNAHKWKLLTPYEQYSAVMLINMLLSFAKKRSSDSQQGYCDSAAQTDILNFINGLKCNNQSMNNDFLKVKVLISKTCLFWQEKRGKNCATIDK